MAKNLVIVESPAKAKTINKYLGQDYTVLASIGHIKDLPAKDLGVDVENNFEPTYEVIPDAEAEKHKQLRVIDESGEDYLFPEEYFRPIDLPQDVKAILRHTS